MPSLTSSGTAIGNEIVRKPYFSFENGIDGTSFFRVVQKQKSKYGTVYVQLYLTHVNTFTFMYSNMFLQNSQHTSPMFLVA